MKYITNEEIKCLIDACEYVIGTRFGNPYGLTVDEQLKASNMAADGVVEVFRDIGIPLPDNYEGIV